MYSIPQQAVTNGFWKMLFLRAQPSTLEAAASALPRRLFSNQLMASSRRVIKSGSTLSSPNGLSGTLPSGFWTTGKDFLSFTLAPLEGALAPDVDEARGQGRHEGEHLEVGEPAELLGLEISQEGTPRIDEDALDVEDDEQEGDQVELDRVAPACAAQRRVAALEGGLLDRGDALGAEEAGEERDRHAHDPGEQQQDQDGNVLREGAVHSGGLLKAAQNSGVSIQCQRTAQKETVLRRQPGLCGHLRPCAAGQPGGQEDQGREQAGDLAQRREQAESGEGLVVGHHERAVADDGGGRDEGQRP